VTVAQDFEPPLNGRLLLDAKRRHAVECGITDSNATVQS
jgi:hypothetical protein